MEMEYIYVLREDMYHEWAWENGATNLISSSYNLDTILKDLKRYLIMEKNEDEERIIGDDINNQNIDNITYHAHETLVNSSIYSVNVYTSKGNYSNGRESGCLVIEKIEVK